MTALGWGLDRYALDPYGSTQLGVGINLVHAVAVSTHDLQLTLSGVPLHASTAVSGDALNPSTWLVQNLSTGAFLHVVAISPVTTTVYSLKTFEKFGSVKVQHRVSSTTLRDTFGQLLVPPTSADFAGITAEEDVSQETRAANQKLAARDLANSQTPQSPAGVLRINSDGDYINVTGVDLVRKLIFRRLMTKPGDFFHLPNYGAALVNSKEPMPVGGDLIKLKATIESQVLLEPEVSEAKATLSLDTQGILTVTVLAKLRQTGQQISIGLKTPQGVQL